MQDLSDYLTEILDTYYPDNNELLTVGMLKDILQKASDAKERDDNRIDSIETPWE